MSEESVIRICKTSLSRFPSEESGIHIRKRHNIFSNKNRPRKRGRQSKAQRKRRLQEKLSRPQSFIDDLKRFLSSNKPENKEIQGAVTPCKTGDKITNRIRNFKEKETLDNAIKVKYENTSNVQQCDESAPNVQKCYENASNVQKCIESASNVQKCRQLLLHPSYSFLSKKHSESAPKIQKQRQLPPQDDLNKKCTGSPQSKKILYKVILPQGCVLNPLQLINKICLPVNQEQKTFNPMSSLILPNCIVNCDKTTDINQLNVKSHLHSSEINCGVENGFHLNENKITVQTSDLSNPIKQENKDYNENSPHLCNVDIYVKSMLT